MFPWIPALLFIGVSMNKMTGISPLRLMNGRPLCEVYFPQAFSLQEEEAAVDCCIAWLFLKWCYVQEMPHLHIGNGCGVGCLVELVDLALCHMCCRLYGFYLFLSDAGCQKMDSLARFRCTVLECFKVAVVEKGL